MSIWNLWSSLTLFRVMGLPVQVHTTFLVFPAGFLVGAGWRYAGWRGVAEGLVLLVVLGVSGLLHEFAHILVARRYGCATRRVLLMPIGFMADMECLPREPYEIWMATAGPAVSAILGGLAVWCSSLIGEPETRLLESVQMFLSVAGFFNLGMAGFNMIPWFPMDGGRVLRSVLALMIGWGLPLQACRAHVVATRIVVRYVGRPMAMAAVAATVFYTHAWFHLLLVGFLIVAGEAEFLLTREREYETRWQSMLSFLPQTGGEREGRSRRQREPRLQGIEVCVGLTQEV